MLLKYEINIKVYSLTKCIPYILYFYLLYFLQAQYFLTQLTQLTVNVIMIDTYSVCVNVYCTTYLLDCIYYTMLWKCVAIKTGVWGQHPQQASACAVGTGSEPASDPCRRHGQKLVSSTP